MTGNGQKLIYSFLVSNHPVTIFIDLLSKAFMVTKETFKTISVVLINLLNTKSMNIDNTRKQYFFHKEKLCPDT